MPQLTADDAAFLLELSEADAAEDNEDEDVELDAVAWSKRGQHIFSTNASLMKTFVFLETHLVALLGIGLLLS